MRYKHVVLTRYGGPEVLQVVEDDVPEPKIGEVRVKVLAAGVAFADVMMRHGKYPGAPSLPFTPGYDLAGVVDKPDASVVELAVGQMVAALPQFGGYSQYICLPLEELVSVPPSVEPVEVSCLMLNYVTAYQMLHRVARVKPGEKVLVHGAAGGVGTALLQLGTLAHLEMYGTASTTKRDLVSSLGATPIDYKTEDFVTRIRALTGDGVDVVFDSIGGSHITRSFQTLRKKGRLVAYGLSAILESGSKLVPIVMLQLLRMVLWSALPNGKRVTVYGIIGLRGLKKRRSEWFREDVTILLDLLRKGKIKPIIAAQLPLEDAAHAHELLEKAQVQGKIVLIPNT